MDASGTTKDTKDARCFWLLGAALFFMPSAAFVSYCVIQAKLGVALIF